MLTMLETVPSHFSLKRLFSNGNHWTGKLLLYYKDSPLNLSKSMLVKVKYVYELLKIRSTYLRNR